MTKTDLQGTRLLVIGAGGFIGGFIAEEGLRRGMDVTVAVRKSTSRRYLTDPRLHFLVLDYDDPTSLTATFERSTPWDYVIYNLGATKAVNYWWGLNSGVIDVKLADSIPPGLAVLAQMLRKCSNPPDAPRGDCCS